MATEFKEVPLENDGIACNALRKQLKSCMLETDCCHKVRTWNIWSSY